MKNKKSWLLIATIVLVIMNISILALVWIMISKKPEARGPLPGAGTPEKLVHFLRQDLKLDEPQVKQFLKQRQEHRMKSEQILKTIHSLKKEMFDELFKEQPDTVKVNQLIDSIGEKQKEIDRLTFNHFAELKKLCGEQQQEKLQKILDEFFHQQRLPRPGEPGPPANRPPLPPRN